MPQARAQPRASALPDARRAGRLALLAAVVIVAIGLFAYGNGFDGKFLFDDHTDITNNVAIRELWPPWRVVLEQGQSGVSGRPLVALSYALNWAASPPDAQGVLDPFGWHAVNLALHLLAALFLFGSVRRALLLPRFAERWGPSATGVGFATAVLWVAHPLTTGAVMYIGQRVECAMGMFFLATFYCAVRAFGAPQSKAWPRLAVAACALGTGCKEVIAAAPILVLLFDAQFVAGTWRGAWNARRSLYVGLFATWLAIALWVVLAQGRSESVGFGDGRVGVWEYATTQAWALVRYLRLALWPSPLIFDYGKEPITAIARWLPHGLALLALLGLTGWGVARRRALAFLGAWWFVILAPTSSVLPIVTELVVEHRAYLPLAAVVLLGVLAVHELLGRAGARVRSLAGPALALVASSALALATRARNPDYRSEIGMWADVVAKLPENDRAQACYGNDLRTAGRIQEAGERYREAVRLAPHDPYWRTNLGTWLLDQRRLDEALAELERAVELLPTHGLGWQNLGAAYQARGARGDDERRIEAWLHALDNGAPGPARLAGELAPLLAARGRHAEALAVYRQALQSAPDDAQLHVALARALLHGPDAALRDPAEAARLARRAFRLSGGADPGLLELAGEALVAQGRATEAASAFSQAATLWRAHGRASQADAADARARALLGERR